MYATAQRLERVPRDLGIAVFVGLGQLCFGIAMSHAQEGRTPLDALGVALLLAGPAALVGRKRASVLVLAFTLAVGLAYWLLDYSRGPVVPAAVVAFVTVVLEGRRLAAWSALAVGWAAFTWLPRLVHEGDAPPLGKAIGVALWLFLLGAFAEILRAKQERRAELERRREQQALAEAGQERLRIARELHDVLAHNVSLINVQAGVALHLLDDQPERARPALEAIKEASSETLHEIRSVLSILRRPGEQPPRSPTAGVAGVGELVSRTSAAGIPVELDVAGDERPLPAPVDLAVYRVMQEALTNVARHARPASARVRLSYEPNGIEIEVLDDGAGAAATGRLGGNGIAGMRERVAALGGDFAAGPRPGRGFRVHARLPLEQEAPAERGYRSRSAEPSRTGDLGAAANPSPAP